VFKAGGGEVHVLDGIDIPPVYDNVALVNVKLTH